jgi:hypothetical protein
VTLLEGQAAERHHRDRCNRTERLPRALIYHREHDRLLAFACRPLPALLLNLHIALIQ